MTTRELYSILVVSRDMLVIQNKFGILNEKLTNKSENYEAN